MRKIVAVGQFRFLKYPTGGGFYGNEKSAIASKW